MKRRIVVTSAVALALIALPSAPAQAHDSLLQTTPSQGAEATTVDEVSLRFSDALLDLNGIGNAFVIRVEDRAGAYYGDGCVDLVDDTMSMPVELGEPGRYTVTWRAVSTDGHTISDAFDFDYVPADGNTASVGSDTAPACAATAPSEAAPSDGVAESPRDTVGLIVGLSVGGVLVIGGLVGLAIGMRLRRR